MVAPRIVNGPRLYVGLMSGTSLDGVDAALVCFEGDRPQLVQTVYLPYTDPLRVDLLAIQASGPDELHRAALLGNQLADLYAEAVCQLLHAAGVLPEAVRAIGMHGQTVRHRPDAAYTLQLGSAPRLAERSGVPVVADFRSRDLAAGGQGAPLVPAFHEAVFGSATEYRGVLNIGGIANLTDLAPDGTVRGWDTGPGNLLLDAWCQKHCGARFDRGGAWGAQGVVLPALLGRLAEEPYFALPSPKSTGRDLFHAGWLQSFLSGDEAPQDVQATLVALTASSIAASVQQHMPAVEVLLVCGGGAHNQALLDDLARRLPAVRIGLTDELGVAVDWVEAVAFAWLAQRFDAGLPGNLPAVTGADGPRILGAWYPA